MADTFVVIMGRALQRGGWLLAHALAGGQIEFCRAPSCRWAHAEHYWAPDCPPQPARALEATHG